MANVNHTHETDLERYLASKGIKKKKPEKEYLGIKIGGIAKPFMRKK